MLQKTFFPRGDLPGVSSQKLWGIPWKQRQRGDWAGQPVKGACLYSELWSGGPTGESLKNPGKVEGRVATSKLQPSLKDMRPS